MISVRHFPRKVLSAPEISTKYSMTVGICHGKRNKKGYNQHFDEFTILSSSECQGNECRKESHNSILFTKNHNTRSI